MSLNFRSALPTMLLATSAILPGSIAFALEVPTGGSVASTLRSGQHYRIHTFNRANDGTGAFSVPGTWPGGTLTADYLVVGGGGARCRFRRRRRNRL
ncbi:MAG: hypothetical protein R3C97_13470 [Geminicoccaceae bacterium]